MYAIAPSNNNYDFEAFNAAGAVWNGSAFVTYAVADYLTYRIAATKLGNANDDNVECGFSASDVTGAVRWVLRLRGASLALSYIMYTGPDINETVISNVASAVAQTAAAALRTSLGLESANLGSAVAALINKKNVTDNGDGSFTIAIRNAADSATLATIKHWPLTGETIVL